MPSLLRRPPVLRAAAKLYPIFYWLAFAWRRRLPNTTVIAITGSLGKTTTKEVLAAVLEADGPTYRTHRNQNSLILVILNVLKIRPHHRYAVLEVASSGPGQMSKPAKLVSPDVVIMLNVLRTHTTEFADLEQHAKEKTILLESLKPGGIVVMNDDDPLVAAMPIPKGARVYRFGTREGVDARVDQITSGWPNRLRFKFHQGNESREVRTQLVGASRICWAREFGWLSNLSTRFQPGPAESSASTAHSFDPSTPDVPDTKSAVCRYKTGIADSAARRIIGALCQPKRKASTQFSTCSTAFTNARAMAQSLE